MTEQEKLAALIKEAAFPISRWWAEIIADHLIDNGVTVVNENNARSKWIPTAERLPTVADAGADGNVLTLSKSGIPWIVPLDRVNPLYHAYWTHVPEMPKGE